MKRFSLLLLWTSLALLVLSCIGPAPAVQAASDGGYQTGFDRWRGADGGFGGWTLSGVSLTNGNLVLDPAVASSGSDPYPAGGYYGGNFYNAGSFVVGEATSPEMTSFAFQEAIASWNAETPAGTWVETQIRAKLDTRWTKWYNLGVWAADDSTIRRHSVRLQGDADGYVAVDTLVLAKSKVPASGYQLKVRLFSADGVAVPTVRFMSLAYSTSAPKKAPATSAGNPTLWNSWANVPECSQMIYPDGGNVWCSPTSTSMVLGYWKIGASDCSTRVHDAVAGTYDWIYDGNGNWPFNTAYAASKGLEAYVARYTSLADLEKWTAAGVPVVMSIAWGKKDLTGAPIPSSSGHLVVLDGFDQNGNPVVNDPAAAGDADVQRTYIRSELESVWLTNSGGTVYLIYPIGHSIP